MVVDNKKEKHRYVLTKIDKTPKFLIMSRCNFCPFLINDINASDAKCSKFINNDTIRVDNNHITIVSAYIQKSINTDMKILTPIPIPNWCGLPNHLSKISPNNEIFYVKNNKLQIESGQNYAITIQVISDDEIEFSSEDGCSLVLKHKKNYDTYSFKETFNNKICSCCGNEKEDINREEHLGMCLSCWEENKRNIKKRYNSYINNFRLKRDKDWTDEEYKRVKIKIKVY